MSPRRIFAATTLTMEALVIGFAILVAKDLSSLSRGAVVGGGLVLAVLCLALAGLLRRPGAYAAGWALQVVVVLCGFVVPLMFVMGAIFLGLWWASMHYGLQAERIRRENEAAYAVELARREGADQPEG
ncbi:MAG: DUF4233 domain-containing protein [Actinomycetes bacterium]